MSIKVYHDATKHTAEKLLSNRHVLDWKNQPNPFRRYEGAELIELNRDLEASPLGYYAALSSLPEASPLSGPALSRLFYFSLALSAWKAIPGTGSRWALRVNPSSGNLHPTEAHVLTPSLGDMKAGVFHYASDGHLLERRYRGDLREEVWGLAGSGPLPSLIVVLTTIFWREAWKYQSRAYRYCLHDLGHACGAIDLSARALGWGLRPHADFADEKLSAILGLAESDEKPYLVLGIDTGEAAVPEPRENGSWKGKPNRLSPWVAPYPLIDEAHLATIRLERGPTPGAETVARELSFAPPPVDPPAHAIARKRRSAVAFDGKSGIPLAALLRILRSAALPASAEMGGLVTAYCYCHRVEDLPAGLYRFDASRGELESRREGDVREIARRVSCFQDIGSDCAVAFSLVGNFAEAFARQGERGYRLMHFAAGNFGHFLYLGATAEGLDATGIGCFQDDEINEYLALPPEFQVVYNFTIGKAVTDTRLTTLPAYEFPDPTQRQGVSMGFATAEGTRRYAQRSKDFGLSGEAYRQMERTGWICSVLGFGSYRVERDTPEHREALRLALTSGCNLIDTSTNYTDGESESLVGEVIAAVTSHDFRREEFIVVSKVGYVQGQNLATAQEREQAGQPYPEMVKYAEGCWHCLHPDFISEQLGRSLERLRMERVDAYLLHNPEYFLSDAKNRKTKSSSESLRDQFYLRIRAAFERLEEEVDGGRISCYGVSSNTFGGMPEDMETTSLSRLWEIAESIAEKRHGHKTRHHFSVVQLPANLFEGGPVLQKNTGVGQGFTALEYAKEKGLAVLVNRPLNAFFNEQMLRLADFSVPESSATIPSTLATVSQLEKEFNLLIAPSIQTDKDSLPATSFFRWGEELSNPQITALPLEHWSQLEGGMVRPQLKYLTEQLDRHFAAVPQAGWAGWRDRYLPEIDRLLLLIRAEGARRSREVSMKVSAKLNPFLPEELRGQTLSRKALSVLINTPGVTSVLNGMRSTSYVKDSLGAAKSKAFPVTAKLFQAFRLGG